MESKELQWSEDLKKEVGEALANSKLGVVADDTKSSLRNFAAIQLTA